VIEDKIKDMGNKLYDLSKSLEDYLEAIYLISLDKNVVRVKSVVSKMDVKTASVIGALKKLEAKGYIEHERYGYIELTEEGEIRAANIYDKHSKLLYFLNKILGVREDIAEKDACNMEHYISDDTFEKLIEFIENQKSIIKP